MVDTRTGEDECCRNPPANHDLIAMRERVSLLSVQSGVRYRRSKNCPRPSRRALRRSLGPMVGKPTPGKVKQPPRRVQIPLLTTSSEVGTTDTHLIPYFFLLKKNFLTATATAAATNKPPSSQKSHQELECKGGNPIQKQTAAATSKDPLHHSHPKEPPLLPDPLPSRLSASILRLEHSAPSILAEATGGSR